MRTILHITPHMGVGVGRVLLNYFAHVSSHDDEQHAVACLEYANNQAGERAATIGIRLSDRMGERIPELLTMMSQADIVVVHWWNHPLLYALLVNETLPPVRLLLWSHVSGHQPTQNFTGALISYPDRFVLSTPYSFEAPAIRRLSPSVRDAHVRFVFTCAGTEHVAAAEPLPHTGFRVGYVGTVDYCKMHPHFISMSAGVQVPGVRFIVCGGPNELAITEEAIRAGVGDRFDFPGHVDNVAEMLSGFDVFGYPLAPYHYGTGEQVLIEALAAGVPPIVLNNGAERYVVEDGVTGIIAKSEEAYARGIELLYREPQFRRSLAQNARRTARERFTIESLSRSWNALYEEVLEEPKRASRWLGPALRRKRSAAEIFIASLGEHGADFVESIRAHSLRSAIRADESISHREGLFRAKTRGSTFHYLRFFPGDPYLNLWCGLILMAEGAMEEAQRHFSVAERTLGAERVARHAERTCTTAVHAEYASIIHTDRANRLQKETDWYERQRTK